MKPKEIVERIMRQHWDIASCPCWICREGRKGGCHIHDYLDNQQYGRVKVGRHYMEPDDGVYDS